MGNKLPVLKDPWESASVDPWEAPGASDYIAPTEESEKEKIKQMGSMMNSFGSGALNTLTLNYMPELAAKLQQVTGVAPKDTDWTQLRDQLRKQEIEDREKHPILGALGTGTGAVASAAWAPEAKLYEIAGKTSIPRILRTLVSAGGGGVRAGLANVPQKEGESDYFQPKERLKQAGLGAAISGGLSGLMESAQHVGGGKQGAYKYANKALRQTPKDIENAIEKNGVSYNGEDMGKFMYDEGVMDGMPGIEKINKRAEPIVEKYGKRVGAVVDKMENSGLLIPRERIIDEVNQTLQKELDPLSSTYEADLKRIKKLHDEFLYNLDDTGSVPLDVGERVPKPPVSPKMIQNSKKLIQNDLDFADLTKIQKEALLKQYDRAKLDAYVKILDDEAHKMSPELFKEYQTAKAGYGKAKELLSASTAARARQVGAGINSPYAIGLPSTALGTASILGRPEAALGIPALFAARAIANRAPQLMSKALYKQAPYLAPYIASGLAPKRDELMTKREKNPWEDIE